MILKIKGNIKPYYVQTLVMIFFPGVKFPENEEITDETVITTLELYENDGFLSASASIKQGAREVKAESAPRRFDGYDMDRARKIEAGETFMKAGAAFTGFKPPWGILTGVRPAKVATELLEDGKAPEEAAEIISRDYFVTPVKARLAADVAKAESKLINDGIRRECSVYIGIPFCPTRCAYCSFVSYTSQRLLKLIPDYLTALENDINGVFRVIGNLGLKVRTVYIGGGTPTVLDEKQLEFLLKTVRSNITELSEFTLEAGRPDTITAEKLSIAKAYGVSRISVNTQTLNDDVLAKIGRSHSSEMFFRAYEMAKNSGISNINVDLIAGLPYDTTESFMHSIDGVVALDPENITVHTFSVKKSSEFKSEGKFDPSSAVAAESVDYSQRVLTSAGYLPYYMYRQKNTVGNLENIGYAKEGHEGLYNVYMMEEIHSIFASGASSVTKLVSLPKDDGSVKIERFFRPKYPYEYLDELKGEDARLCELEERAREFYRENF